MSRNNSIGNHFDGSARWFDLKHETHNRKIKNNEYKHTIEMRVIHTYRIQQMKEFCLQNCYCMHAEHDSFAVLKPTNMNM
jgi:hypothetical protein